jgi:hypothetical protein
MTADGASSIQVTVRVRPFTIREAAQLTKSEDGPLFLGDGSLAGVPQAPKLGQKGLRSVIKVVDEKCLYVPLNPRGNGDENFMLIGTAEYLIHQKTTQSSASAGQLSLQSARRTRHSASIVYLTRTPPKAMFTKRPPRIC